MLSTFKKWAFSGLILVPVIIYLAYAFIHTAPLFFADDFHLLKTIVWMQDVAVLRGKVALFIQQHNEHRIVIPRLLTFLDYKLEGHINWRTLVMLGNVMWVSVLFFFYHAFKNLKAPLWCFIPVPWILLQPQYYDNVTWSISILQQSVVVFWYGLFCLFCARKQFRWALLVAMIATFTHGNGIFSFALGIVFLVLDRRWKDVAIWVAVLVAVALAYFWGFQKGQNADFQRSLADPLRLLAAFLAFFGSLTRVLLTSSVYSVICGGAFALVLAFYLLPKVWTFIAQNRQLPVFDRQLLGNVIFLAITGLLVSVSRSWAGVDSVIAPRYQHYSPFVACWVYLVLLAVVKGNARLILAIAFAAGALLYNGLCYFVYNEEIVYRKNWLVADAENWTQNSIFVNYASSFNQNINGPYSEAVKRGICETGPSPLPMPANNAPVDSALKFDVAKEIVVEEDASGVYQRDFLRITNKDLRGWSYLLLRDVASGKSYWLATRLSNAGIRALVTRQEVYKPGFSTSFLAENVAPGKYRLGVLNGDKFVWTNENVTIAGR